MELVWSKTPDMIIGMTGEELEKFLTDNEGWIIWMDFDNVEKRIVILPNGSILQIIEPKEVDPSDA